MLSKEEQLRFSFYHLYRHCLSITNGIAAIVEAEEKANQVPLQRLIPLVGMGKTFVIIKIDILFEEYKHFNTLCSNVEAKKAIKLILEQIKNIAPDYSSFRNEVGAHSLRKKFEDSKRKESIFKEGLENLYSNPYKLPNTSQEFSELIEPIQKLLLELYRACPKIAASINMGNFPPLSRNQTDGETD